MRRAIYSQKRNHRIISCPNGLWVCQTLKGSLDKLDREMRKFTDSRGRKREVMTDPWVDDHRPTTREEAFRQLKALEAVS